jgi:hypothetical protein
MIYCGVIVIFTILIGGCLDILGLILSILISVIQFIIKINKKCTPKKKKNNQTQYTNESNNLNHQK